MHTQAAVHAFNTSSINLMVPVDSERPTSVIGAALPPLFLSLAPLFWSFLLP